MSNWLTGRRVESFFNLLKCERIRRRKYKTREEARQNVFDYIKFFYTRSANTLGTVLCHLSPSNSSRN
jgi:hypothetical protein